ncbi:copper amine oxidase N-terminal domain-containing protein [Paenibacillus flagellatus]|uniref:Copper amine oxidase n=1 Tax=Paenibacillus flagellatus TaxID=2211139 RepID=A0A2V5JZ33_9BACL|nr:copper amine oxidase N-terminal domain-containing protein [Paenibacillus flagellatus]PYI50564.1 copper amine oxidase [Paenibacillus flagellatus]
MNHTMKKSFAIAAVAALMATGTAYASTPAATQANEIVPISAPSASSPVSIEVNRQAIAETGYRTANGTVTMLPLRAVTESLGFTLTWNPETLSVDLSKGSLFTTVTTGEDRYTIDNTHASLGTATALVDNKLYVPASFVGKVLHGSVAENGASIAVSLEERQKTVQAQGVITGIRTSDGGRASIHIQGAGTDGIVLKAGPDTVVEMADGTPIALSDLHLGLTVEAEHSLAATLSLPPQTTVFRMTVKDAKLEKDKLGTAGSIEDVRTDDKGNRSVVIKGEGLSDVSPSEVVLRIPDDTAIVDKNGVPAADRKLAKGTKVIGFYGPLLTKSLPPIGSAWKIVVDTAE